MKFPDQLIRTLKAYFLRNGITLKEITAAVMPEPQMTLEGTLDMDFMAGVLQQQFKLEEAILARMIDKAEVDSNLKPRVFLHESEPRYPTYRFRHRSDPFFNQINANTDILDSMERMIIEHFHSTIKNAFALMEKIFARTATQDNTFTISTPNVRVRIVREIPYVHAIPEVIGKVAPRKMNELEALEYFFSHTHHRIYKITVYLDKRDFKNFAAQSNDGWVTVGMQRVGEQFIVPSNKYCHGAVRKAVKKIIDTQLSQKALNNIIEKQRNKERLAA